MNEEYFVNAFIMAFLAVFCIIVSYKYPPYEVNIWNIGMKVYIAFTIIMCIYYILVAFGMIPHIFIGRA